MCIFEILVIILFFQINEKNISSFPVECNTVDYAKKIAAKHALTILKKQYGENIVYPIASDINTMAFNIKDVFKYITNYINVSSIIDNIFIYSF